MEFKKPFFSFGGHFEAIRSTSKPLLNISFQEVSLLDSSNEMRLRFSPLKSKILILLHGLGSDWNTSEGMWSVKAADDFGWSVAQVQWPRRPASHAGQKEHFETALQYLENLKAAEKLEKFEEVVVLGSSIGASILLNWARGSSKSRVHKIVAVTPPLDLGGTARRLARGFSRLYDFRLNRILNSWFPVPGHRPWLSVLELDELFTARYHGFKNRDDYYRKCSAMNFLDEIEIPILFLTAKNDPLVDYRTIESAALGEKRKVILTEGGGHGGYGRWMYDFISKVLVHEI